MFASRKRLHFCYLPKGACGFPNCGIKAAGKRLNKEGKFKLLNNSCNSNLLFRFVDFRAAEHSAGTLSIFNSRFSKIFTFIEIRNFGTAVVGTTTTGGSFKNQNCQETHNISVIDPQGKPRFNQ